MCTVSSFISMAWECPLLCCMCDCQCALSGPFCLNIEYVYIYNPKDCSANCSPSLWNIQPRIWVRPPPPMPHLLQFNKKSRSNHQKSPQTSWSTSLPLQKTPNQRVLTYCWWKKSCTSWYGKYPVIYRVSYIPGGWPDFFHQQIFSKWPEDPKPEPEEPKPPEPTGGGR